MAHRPPLPQTQALPIDPLATAVWPDADIARYDGRPRQIRDHGLTSDAGT